MPLESPVNLASSGLNGDGLLGIGTKTNAGAESDKINQGNGSWPSTFDNSSSPIVDISGENKWRNDVFEVMFIFYNVFKL